VREIVIVISDLYLVPGHAGGAPEAGGSGAPNTGAIGTLPGLEHVARFGGRRSIEGEGGWRPWLARWLGRDDLAGVAPAVIAAGGATVTSAALADAEHPDHVRATAREPVEPRGATAWIATPVHLIAGLTSLHLDRRSILRLSRADLEGFALDFNRTFGDSGLHLLPLPGGDFLMQGPATLIAATTEPSRALVGDLEASLAKGSDSKALKRLGAELEMWLHEHPVNEVRRRRGELPVSTLWLWGGGSSLTQPNSLAASPSSPSDVAFGSDPYLIGLWYAKGGRTHALPDDKLARLLADPHAERAVLIAEVTPMLHANPQWTVFEALAELDRLYVSPAIAALRKGAVESVVLIANDTELPIGRRDNLKFWRRALPAMARLQA
jgi:hypothetical protein